MWKSHLDVPEDGSAQVHVVLHQTHARIPGPTLLVVVAHNVLVVRVRMLGQIALDEVACLVRIETEEDPHFVNVAAIQANWVASLCGDIFEGQELVRALKLGEITLTL